MIVNLFIDRGNGLAKTITVLGDMSASNVDAQSPKPQKHPSLIREVAGEGIKIPGRKVNYVFGNRTLINKQGRAFSTLEERSKTAYIEIVVADLIHQAIPEGSSEDIELNLICSSPFSSTADDINPLVSEIKSRLQALSRGFSVNGVEYGKVQPQRIGVMPEGLSLLDCDHNYNGVIDLGLGTLLAGYQDPLKGVRNLPLTGGDTGGCQTWLQAVLNDGDFLKDVADKGFTAAPSPEKLCQLLGNARWDIKGVDFVKYLKRYAEPVVIRVENAAKTLRSTLSFADPDNEVEPSIAMIGGGASLFSKILSNEQHDQLTELGVDIFGHLPDLQTVLMLEQAFRRNPERFKSFTKKRSEKVGA